MDYKKMVKDILDDFLKEKNLELFDVEYLKEDESYILRVLVDNHDENINIDELTSVNEYLSANLNDDDFNELYYLEVSSPGAERPIRSSEELKKNIDKYIYVEANEAYYGYLVETTDDSLVIKINLKGRMKNIKIDFKDIKNMRRAVKF